MRREERVVLAALNTFLKKDVTNLSGFKTDRMEWEELDGFARSNDLIPLLYRSAQESGFPIRVPEEFLMSWKDCYYSVARRNLLLLNELKKLVKASAPENFLVIKGAFLAPLVYDNIALRPMHDIDIIVRAQEIEEILSLLRQDGFRIWGTPEEKERHRRLGRVVLEKEVCGERIYLEIHSKLLWSSFFLPVEEYFLAREEVRILDFNVYVPEKHLHFIYLLTHWINHMRERSSLIWLVDIALFLKGLDWNTLDTLCRARGLQNGLFHALTMAKEYFGIEIPESNADELCPRGVAAATYRILRSNPFLLSIFLMNPGNLVFPGIDFLREQYPIENFEKNAHKIRLLFWKDTIKKAFRIFKSAARECGTRRINCI